MLQSLMLGITERDMQAVIDSYDLKAFYYPTLFPLKESFNLSWRALETRSNLRVAGDVVARGSSIGEKMREAVSRIQGDIPKIAIKRKKDENELSEYDVMIAMSAGNANSMALIEAWAEDTNFCWNGVASRIEWLALQSISTGRVRLTKDNSTNVVSEYDVDYQLDKWQKVGFQTGSSIWSAATTAKPLTKDIRGIIENARKRGISIKYLFMNNDTFSTFSQTDEVIKLCSSFLGSALNISQIPSLAQVNATIAGIPYMMGAQIVLIDQNITVEKIDGVRTTANPFADGVVLFSDRKVIGTTFWKTPVDMRMQNTKALSVMNGHTCLKKFSTEDPISEITEGIANAFPVWTNSGSSVLMDVTADTFTK